MQSASIRATAKAFSIPARTLYQAVRSNELAIYCVAGRRNILLWEDVRAYVRKHPAPRVRTAQTAEACHG
jgi:hypothetical protein